MWPRRLHCCPTRGPPYDLWSPGADPASRPGGPLHTVFSLSFLPVPDTRHSSGCTCFLSGSPWDARTTGRVWGNTWIGSLSGRHTIPGIFVGAPQWTEGSPGLGVTSTGLPRDRGRVLLFPGAPPVPSPVLHLEQVLGGRVFSVWGTAAYWGSPRGERPSLGLSLLL